MDLFAAHGDFTTGSLRLMVHLAVPSATVRRSSVNTIVCAAAGLHISKQTRE